MALQDTKNIRGWKHRKDVKEAVVPWRKRHRSAKPEAQIGERVQPATPTPMPEFKPRKVENHAGAIGELKVRPTTGRLITLDARGRVKVDLRDLMETAISAIRNSHLTFEEIRERGGPHPSTMTRWLEERETIQPHLATIVAALNAVDYEVYFGPRRGI